MSESKTSTKIVLIFVAIVLALMAIVSWNAFRVKRVYFILYNDQLGFCFMVDDSYKYRVGKDFIQYSGGKNKGRLELLKRDLSSDIKRVEMNGFEAGYKKVKNKRIYEYKLNGGYVFRDTFEIVERMPVNLVPYKEDCSKIKDNFLNNIEIFKGVLK